MQRNITNIIPNREWNWTYFIENELKFRSNFQPSRLLPSWISELLSKVSLLKPKFIALHLQEVGGKTYEKSMEYVQEFIRLLLESSELENFNRIRVYLDEDYTSAEHFTVNIFCIFFFNCLYNFSLFGFSIFVLVLWLRLLFCAFIGVG